MELLTSGSWVLGLSPTLGVELTKKERKEENKKKVTFMLGVMEALGPFLQDFLGSALLRGLALSSRWLPGTDRATHFRVHIRQERAPYLTPFLVAINLILLVLLGSGLPVPEPATWEEDGIAISLESISTPHNKVGAVGPLHDQHTSIAKLELILN